MVGSKACRQIGPAGSWWVIAACTSAAYAGGAAVRVSTRWSRRTHELSSVAPPWQPGSPSAETKWLVRTSSPASGFTSPTPSGNVSSDAASPPRSTTVTADDAENDSEPTRSRASATDAQSSRRVRSSTCTGKPMRSSPTGWASASWWSMLSITPRPASLTPILASTPYSVSVVTRPPAAVGNVHTIQLSCMCGYQSHVCVAIGAWSDPVATTVEHSVLAKRARSGRAPRCARSAPRSPPPSARTLPPGRRSRRPRAGPGRGWRRAPARRPPCQVDVRVEVRPQAPVRRHGRGHLRRVRGAVLGPALVGVGHRRGER